MSCVGCEHKYSQTIPRSKSKKLASFFNQKNKFNVVKINAAAVL